MSSDSGNSMDEGLRAAWRSATREPAPPDLDGKVLAQAAAAADRPRKRTPRWIRPLAYAATLLLGAFIVFNVPSPQQTGDGLEPALPSGDATPSSGTNAADRESARQRFERSADDAASALEGFAATAPTSLGAGRTATPSHADESRRSACEHVPSATPEAWWRCVQSLQNAGDVDAARRELEALYRLHPDFRPPE